MLRKKSDGRLERQQPDGSWAEVSEAEQPEAVRRTGTGVDWSQLSDLFADPSSDVAVYVDEAYAGKEATEDALRALDAGAAAGGDLGLPGGGADVGSGTLVDGATRPRRKARKAQAPRGAGDGSAASVEANGKQAHEAPELSTGVVAENSEELAIEVPGLTSARAGSVLERLRRRRGLSTGVKREVVRVEVSERAASPRGPAVKETTERRIVRKVKEKTGVSRQATTKPAPGSLAESPRWMQELFETHFRSSRSMELRRSMNRMKLSRQD